MRGLLLWSGGGRSRLALVVLTVLAGVLAVLPAQSVWVGTWKGALDQGTGSLLLIGCVCAGSAAFTYGTMSAHEWDISVAGMSRALVGWLGPLVGLWLLGVLVMVACTAALVSTASVNGSKPSLGMLGAVPLVTTALAAEVALGAVLGVTLPRPVSVPAATIVPFFLEGFSRGGFLPGVFRTGGATGDLGGQTYDWRVLLLSAAVCALLALALVVVLSQHAMPARRWSTAAGLACLVAAVPPWWSLESQGDERYIWQAAPRLACAGASPEICISADTTRPLHSLAREAHRQAAALLSLGVKLPERFSQPLEQVDPADGHLVLAGDQSTSERADPWLVSSTLAFPAACPEFSSPQVPVAALAAQQAMTLWIYDQTGRRSSNTLPDSPASGWLDQPIEHQRDWVVHTYAALRECRLDDVQPPYESLW